MKNTKFTCGMYGGAFNPLHMGHVRDLCMAANQCDKLIVVLCSTNSKEEIPVAIRYRWLYETVKHYPNVKIFHLKEDGDTKDSLTKEQWLQGAEQVKAFAGETITAIFYGDDYEGKDNFWAACYPEAKHVIFPRNEISSTRIRERPYMFWEWMPSYVRSFYVKKVLILGPESTGKSVLTESLARTFNTTFVEEVGRDWSQLSGTCQWMLAEDYTNILLRHKVKQMEQIKKANRVFFEDTNCFYTRYFLKYLAGDAYHMRDELLATMLELYSEYHLVLLLAPTVEFVQDGDRSDSDQEARERCFEFLKSCCITNGLKYRVIDSPDYNNRYCEAVGAVEALFKCGDLI